MVKSCHKNLGSFSLLAPLVEITRKIPRARLTAHVSIIFTKENENEKLFKEFKMNENEKIVLSIYAFCAACKKGCLVLWMVSSPLWDSSPSSTQVLSPELQRKMVYFGTFGP